MSGQEENCILIADDDLDDQCMLKQAFSGLYSKQKVNAVSDGVELFEYLLKKGKYKAIETIAPKVILPDLNMSNKDGRECLIELKAQSELKKIPVVIYSNSSNSVDISFAYTNGARSSMTKPYSYQELLKAIEIFKNYWLMTVKTPTT